MRDNIINKDNWEIKRNSYLKHRTFRRKSMKCISCIWVAIITIVICFIWGCGWLYPMFIFRDIIPSVNICGLVQILYGFMYLIISIIITVVVIND